MRMNNAFYAALAAAFTFVAAPASAEPLVNAEAGALFDSNVSNGQIRSDIKSDTAAYAAASIAEVVPIGDNSRVTLTGAIEAQSFVHYSELNRTAPQIAVAFRTKSGLGADTPWLRISAAATRLYVHSDLRSGWLYRGGAAIGKRVNERWSLDAEYAAEKRTANSGEEEVPGLSAQVFDQSSHSLLFGANYVFSDATVLRLGYTRRSGDVTATTKPAKNIYYASSAIAEDNIFGEDGYAYTLYAVTHTFAATLSYELDRHSALNLSYRRQISHGVNDFNYYNNIAGLSYSYRY